MAIFDTEKYFNAQEAFNRTCKVKNEIMNNSLNEIYNNINTSIKLGKTSVTIYEHYDDDVINFLKALKYTVEKQNDPDKCNTGSGSVESAAAGCIAKVSKNGWSVKHD